MMPKLILQFEGRVLKDYAVVAPLTIGRMPDNAIIIDNPAVSGHHACVTVEGTNVVIEDLRSTNGTFVNEQPVKRHVLRHGDVLLVGKHHLVFDTAEAAVQPVPPALQGLGDTVYLDTKQHRALRATLDDARASAERVKPRVAKPTARTGVLHVLAGHADHSEFDLTAQTSLIGRSSAAHVRLRGWFKPSVAVAIARSSDGYVATPMSGKTSLNYEPMTARHHLQEGDVMNVSGLVLEFRWKESHPAESAACA
jgi:pSer/pThr/pTyr-binding forkhead associated (FHA) protein